tara:strand:+ start:493 stop:735 length:243 start_codon:yes stop_codon:yes gene_type:complete
MITYNAIDENNIPRVYGIGKNDYEAKRQCELALNEYIKSKPIFVRYYYSKIKYKIVKVEEEMGISLKELIEKNAGGEGEK